MTTLTLPAGTYVLGDPCYAVPDADWMAWLGDQISEDIIDNGLGGRRAIGFHTAHGDGCFVGSDGFGYPVDAGLIGLVPLAVADQSPVASWRSCSTVITFDRDFDCTREGGFLTFGHIEIDTEDQLDDDDDEDNFCEKCGCADVDRWQTLCHECEDEDESAED